MRRMLFSWLLKPDSVLAKHSTIWKEGAEGEEEEKLEEDREEKGRLREWKEQTGHTKTETRRARERKRKYIVN